MTNDNTAEQLSVIGVGLSGAITVAVTEGGFSYWNVAIGIMLLSVILAYDNTRNANYRQVACYSFVTSFCVMMMIAGVIDEIKTFNNAYLILWGILSLITFYIRKKVLKRRSSIANNQP